jgi:phosphoglycolate phosphatase
MPDALALVHAYPVVAFDMDGVLLDSFRCWWELLNDALREHGKGPLTREQFEMTWGQDVEADRRMFFPEWSAAQIMTHYQSALPKFAAMVDVEPDAATTLAALRRQGKKLAVATNSPMAIATNLLEGASLAKYFDVIAGLDLVAEGKPAPDLLHLIARETGVPPEEMAYVGDSMFDEGAARAAGAFFIGYLRPGDARIERLGDLIAE